MTEAVEKLLLELAERASGAVAVFAADGSIRVANERWQALMEGVPAPSAGSIGDLLASAGFSPVPDQPGAFQRQGELWTVERKAFGHHLLVVARPEGAVAHEAERRAKVFSVASHDIRGPVANVRSYAALLLTGKYQLDDRARRAVEVVLRNADRALALLRSYFDAERSDLLPVPVEATPQDILPLLEAEAEKARAQAAERKVRFIADFPPSLPEVRVDAERFSHMLAAFLAHGLSRTPEHGTLRLQVAAERASLLVRVVDSGAPVPEQQQASLFDWRARAEADHRLSAGFELGLASKEAEAHSGGVRSFRSGEGVTFELTLPL